MGFRYLQNRGSPTRWNVDRCFEYRSRALGSLPDDLRSMVRDERFFPGEKSTFWHADLRAMTYLAGELELRFASDRQPLDFVFRYRRVRKVVTDPLGYRSTPVLIVQELIALRDGSLRHTLSDFGGQLCTIYAEAIEFSEERAH